MKQMIVLSVEQEGASCGKGVTSRRGEGFGSIARQDLNRIEIAGVSREIAAWRAEMCQDLK